MAFRARVHRAVAMLLVLALGLAWCAISSTGQHRKKMPAAVNQATLMVAELQVRQSPGAAAGRTPSAFRHQADSVITTTVPPAPATGPSGPAQAQPGSSLAATPRPSAGPVAAAAPATPAEPAYGCAAALAWLASHSAPGFQFVCPGNALGHEAMTCVNVRGLCPGERLITIADPCPAAYMNEASNSWVQTHLRAGRLDPYGAC